MLSTISIKNILDKNKIKYNSYGYKSYYMNLLKKHGLVPEEVDVKKIFTERAKIKESEIEKPENKESEIEEPENKESEIEKPENKESEIEEPENNESEIEEPVKNYDRLKKIRKNPRKVILKDVNTGEIREFPSIYKVSKFIGFCPQMILNWKNRVWNNKYEITIR